MYININEVLLLKKKRLKVQSKFLNDLLSKESPLLRMFSLREITLSTTSIRPSLNLSKSSLYKNILCFSK